MTHVIIVIHQFDAVAEFTAAMASLCRSGDSVTRVDESVDAPKGDPGATYLAHFASFDEQAFVQAVHSVPWESPEALSAFSRPAGKSRFETIDLQKAFDIGADRKLAAAKGWGVPVSPDQARFVSETYPAVLEARRELILDSLRKPNRYFKGYEKQVSVTTESPWYFECIRIFPERRSLSGTRHEFGPGKEDWKWVTVKHRTICADLVVRGVYFRLMCDEADVGPTTFEHVRAAAASVLPGNLVLKQANV